MQSHELHRTDYDILRLVSEAGESTHRDVYRAGGASALRPKVLVRRWNGLVEAGLLADTGRGTYALTEHGQTLLVD